MKLEKGYYYVYKGAENDDADLSFFVQDYIWYDNAYAYLVEADMYSSSNLPIQEVFSFRDTQYFYLLGGYLTKLEKVSPKKFLQYRRKVRRKQWTGNLYLELNYAK